MARYSEEEKQQIKAIYYAREELDKYSALIKEITSIGEHSISDLPTIGQELSDFFEHMYRASELLKQMEKKLIPLEEEYRKPLKKCREGVFDIRNRKKEMRRLPSEPIQFPPRDNSRRFP